MLLHLHVNLNADDDDDDYDDDDEYDDDNDDNDDDDDDDDDDFFEDTCIFYLLKQSNMWHFIRVFIVCHSTPLEVISLRRNKLTVMLLSTHTEFFSRCEGFINVGLALGL